MYFIFRVGGKNCKGDSFKIMANTAIFTVLG